MKIIPSFTRSPTRDCNAPSPYSSLTLEKSNTLTYVVTDNFDASSRIAIEQGMALANDFLGTSSNERIYMYEPWLEHFTAQRANNAHKETDGRTTKDFFQPPPEGFWLAVELVETDLANGLPSDVAEGPGGKIALAAFTGDATVADFYAAFEDAMVAGTVATETELLARLEDNDAVHSASGEAVAYDGGDYFVGAKANKLAALSPSHEPASVLPYPRDWSDEPSAQEVQRLWMLRLESIYSFEDGSPSHLPAPAAEKKPFHTAVARESEETGNKENSPQQANMVRSTRTGVPRVLVARQRC